MPYQGNTPIESYTPTVKDSFSGNGSTTAFTLSQPTVTNDVRVVVENVVQDPTVAYTVLGTTLTFTSAPVSGTNNIYVVHLGPAVATTQPPSEIANATTFASNLSVQGLFNSVGIDDNADATAITIDSSEVVLVGKTSNTFSQQGVALRANNDSQITRDAGIALSLNRTTNDGDILGLYKAGSTVGSIGTNAGIPYFLRNSGGIAIGNTALLSADSSGAINDATSDLGGSSNRWKDLYLSGKTHSQIIGDGEAGLLFNSGSQDGVLPYNLTAGALDARGTTDIGASGFKFKDLHLSGGVYLGGTGAANKLEDYEEGGYNATFTTQNGSINLSGSQNRMNYTKIGRQVTITGRVVVASVSNPSGYVRFSLPFTNVSESEDEGHTALNVITYNVSGIGSNVLFAEVGPNTAYAILLKSVENSSWSYLNANGFSANDIIYVNGTYLTDA